MLKHRALRDFWTKDHGLTWLLTMLAIAIFLILPIVHRMEVATLVFTVLFAGIILSGVQAMGMPRSIRLCGYLLAVVCVLSHIAVFFLTWPGLDVIELIFNGLALGFLDGIVLYRVFSPGVINANRIMGAVAVYLIAGLVFADCFELMEVLFPGSLRIGTEVGHLSKGSFVYFSFATLTTAGYGDIVPVAPFTRSLATLEAVIGQLYPAVFIGSLISLSAQRRSE